MLSRAGSAFAVCEDRVSPNFPGSTSALLPGSSTPSQRSTIFIASATVKSSGIRTGSPPASRTAFSYCGIDRSAYSRSVECGIGIAIRGGIPADISAHPRNRSQGPRLPVVADLHNQRQHKDDASRHQGSRKRDPPVRDGHIWMDASPHRNNSGSNDSHEQTDCKHQQSSDERYQENPQRYRVPSWRAAMSALRHISNLHHLMRAFRTPNLPCGLTSGEIMFDTSRRGKIEIAQDE